MSEHHGGTASPFRPPVAVAHLLAAYDRPWAFCGGWAVDLFLNRVTRAHKDVDVAIRRLDQRAIQAYLRARGWDLQVAHDGVLSPWVDGDWLELPRHGVWATCPGADPDVVELLLNEIDDTTFRFRRDQSIVRRLDEAFVTAPNGLPVLAVELALLYKSGRPDEPENHADFYAALPELSATQRTWLAAALSRLNAAHTWLAALDP
jgi:hypothetical protein